MTYYPQPKNTAAEVAHQACAGSGQAGGYDLERGRIAEEKSQQDDPPNNPRLLYIYFQSSCSD